MVRHQALHRLTVTPTRSHRRFASGRAIALLGAVILFAFACDRPTPPVESVPLGNAIRAAELADRLASGEAPLILDVRSLAEFNAGHIPGAIHIPHDQMSSRIAELPADHSIEIVVHCQTGRRADAAEAELLAAGYQNVRDLDGHWANWSASGLPSE